MSPAPAHYDDCSVSGCQAATDQASYRFAAADSPGKMAEGVTVDEPTVPYEGGGFLEDGVFETQVLDQFEENQLVGFDCETQMVDFEEGLGNVQTQVLDQFEETQLANFECETPVVDFEEGLGNVQTQVLDQFQETQLVNFDCETQVVDFEEGLGCVQTQVLDQFQETQFVNFECETHVADFGEDLGNVQTQVLDQFQETQVVNFECKKQVVDFDEGHENVQTQVLDQFEVVADSGSEDEDEGEGTGGSETEVLGLSSDELGDENTSGKIRSGSCDEQVTGNSLKSMSVEKRDHSGISYDGHSSSGSVRRGFTSVRSASMRASGLAARTLHMGESGSCSLPNNEHSLEGEKNACVQAEVHRDEGLMNLNGMKCKVGSSAVRKLFSEHDDLDSPDDIPERKDASLGVTPPAGLSYVDSQEPGDLSQEKALEFVDKFVKDNVEESPIKIPSSMTSQEKPLPISGVKGQYILARNANMATPGETYVFNWDDSREDEGGGDLFCRRKEEFFHGVSIHNPSMTDPINWKRRLGETGDKAKPSTIPCKRKRVSTFNSGAKLFMDKGSNETSKKVIGYQCSEHFDVDSSGGHLKAAFDDATVQVMPQAGPDTQMAAEAMEELCMGVTLIDNPSNDSSYDFVRNLKKGVQKQTLDYASPRTTLYSVDNGSPAKRSSIFQKKRSKKSKEPQCFDIKSDGSSKIVLGIAAKKNIQAMASYNSKEQLGEKGGMYLLTGDGLSVEKRTRSSLAAGEVSRAISGESVLKRKRTRSVRNKNQRRDASCKEVRQKGNSELVSDESCELRNAKRSANSAGVIDAGIDSPRIKSKGCIPATVVTPDNSAKPPKSVSPLCAGDEYLKQSCRKNLCTASLMKEIRSLTSSASDASPDCKPLRRRRDMTGFCVLFSQHLDDDTVKQQKKILGRLGASTASSIEAATHFVADEFVRTRNMLEAIASGKPVVTNLWLESCGQACCFLDEKNYILRDTKKEKQFGFSMPGSLARASQRPLLQGKKVLITPNTKPGKETISNLVKAVKGQPIERIGRSGLKDGQVPDDLLILSCEDDYETCLPFLEKGAPIYSSELLLNGIVTQRLEYERHRLFADHVRRTRSTTWVKKGGKNFVPLLKT
ncbi:hypothetical protein MLD38_020505 [Melastoma candidum]|uniref:Uncharacterized protein n=1 Tax=Melastoma candidum TaxID=119954 RepID=A0ACB9QD41_9MYRT|nr:hypothetical protein MLD38_020505 [Melastoma candidum]